MFVARYGLVSVEMSLIASRQICAYRSMKDVDVYSQVDSSRFRLSVTPNVLQQP
jgi:hypothetical protein